MGRRKRTGSSYFRACFRLKINSSVINIPSAGASMQESHAAHRDELLSGKLGDKGDVEDDNALVVISMKRLKKLTEYMRCSTCGEVAQASITKKYFDCSACDMQQV